MAVVVTIPRAHEDDVSEHEYQAADKWHIDDRMTLHVIAARGAGPFSEQGGNLASYAHGAWESVRVSPAH